MRLPALAAAAWGGGCAAQPFFSAAPSLPLGWTAAPERPWWAPTRTLLPEGSQEPVVMRFAPDPALSDIVAPDRPIEARFGEPLRVTIQFLDKYGAVVHNTPDAWTANVTATADSGDLIGNVAEYAAGGATFPELLFLTHPTWPGPRGQHDQVRTRITFRVDTDPPGSWMHARLLTSSTVYLRPAAAQGLRFSLSAPPWHWLPAAVQLNPNGSAAPIPPVQVDLIDSAGALVNPNPYTGLMVAVRPVGLDGRALPEVSVRPSAAPVGANGTALLALSISAPPLPGGARTIRLAFRAHSDALRTSALPVATRAPLLSPGIELAAPWARNYSLWVTPAALMAGELQLVYNRTLPPVTVRLRAAGQVAAVPDGSLLRVAVAFAGRPRGVNIGGPSLVNFDPGSDVAVFRGLRLLTHAPERLRFTADALRWPRALPLPAAAESAALSVASAPAARLQLRQPLQLPPAGVLPGHPLPPVAVLLRRSDGSSDESTPVTVRASVLLGGGRPHAAGRCAESPVRDGAALFTDIVLQGGPGSGGAEGKAATQGTVLFHASLPGGVAELRLPVPVAPPPPSPLAEASAAGCLAPSPLAGSYTTRGVGTRWGGLVVANSTRSYHVELPVHATSVTALATVPPRLGSCVIDSSCLPPTVAAFSGAPAPHATIQQALERALWMNHSRLLQLRPLWDPSDRAALIGASGTGWARLWLRCNATPAPVCLMFPLAATAAGGSAAPGSTPPPALPAFDVHIMPAPTGTAPVRAVLNRTGAERYSLASFSLRVTDPYGRNWSEAELTGEVCRQMLLLHGAPCPPLELRAVLRQRAFPAGAGVVAEAPVSGGEAAFANVTVPTGNTDPVRVHWPAGVRDLGVTAELEIVTAGGAWGVSHAELRRSWEQRDPARWEPRALGPPASDAPPRFVAAWSPREGTVPTAPRRGPGQITWTFAGWDEWSLAAGRATVTVAASGALLATVLPAVPISLRAVNGSAGGGRVALTLQQTPVACPDDWAHRPAALPPADTSFDATFLPPSGWTVVRNGHNSFTVALPPGWGYDVVSGTELIGASLNPAAFAAALLPGELGDPTVAVREERPRSVQLELPAADGSRSDWIAATRPPASPRVSAATVRRGITLVLSLRAERWMAGCSPAPLPGRLRGNRSDFWGTVPLRGGADCGARGSNASRLVIDIPPLPRYTLPRGAAERVWLPELPRGLFASCLQPAYPEPEFTVEEPEWLVRPVQGYPRWEKGALRAMVLVVVLASAVVLPAAMAASGLSAAVHCAAAAGGDLLLGGTLGDACEWVLSPGGTADEQALAQTAAFAAIAVLAGAGAYALWRRSGCGQPPAQGLRLVGGGCCRAALCLTAPALVTAMRPLWQGSAAGGPVAAAVIAMVAVVMVWAVLAGPLQGAERGRHWLEQGLRGRRRGAFATAELLRVALTAALCTAPPDGPSGPVVLLIAAVGAAAVLLVLRPLGAVCAALAVLRAAGEFIAAVALLLSTQEPGAPLSGRRERLRSAAEGGVWLALLSAALFCLARAAQRWCRRRPAAPAGRRGPELAGHPPEGAGGAGAEMGPPRLRGLPPEWREEPAAEGGGDGALAPAPAPAPSPSGGGAVWRRPPAIRAPAAQAAAGPAPLTVLDADPPQGIGPPGTHLYSSPPGAALAP
eukprot:TRINITY_DN9441_c0_g1_i2.p1 TRINITY_DN9441_c0_g1~~TRINITY_DN9441_c0_g1_i2.p1  ORF type:complete len:1671 (+),score=423.17 TRINITY_DN9441_c0_g1_i2:64-5013(+)